MEETPRPMLLILAPAVALVLITCGSEPQGADPGGADTSTVQQYFNGEIFTGVDAAGREWALAAYNPSAGQVCMAYGPVEVQPDGSPGFDNLAIFTASVSKGASTSDGSALLFGTLWSWNEEGNYWRSYGEYWYTYLDAAPILYVKANYEGTRELTEATADVTYASLLSSLAPCKPFDNSPTASPEEISR